MPWPYGQHQRLPGEANHTHIPDDADDQTHKNIAILIGTVLYHETTSSMKRQNIVEIARYPQTEKYRVHVTRTTECEKEK